MKFLPLTFRAFWFAGRFQETISCQYNEDRLALHRAELLYIRAGARVVELRKRLAQHIASLESLNNVQAPERRSSSQDSHYPPGITPQSSRTDLVE